jgi:signal transduction histidine kinase
VLATQPARAAATLDTIGETGRRAIADLRILLGVLRDEDAAQSFDLDALIEPVRRTGLRVDVVQTGDGGPIPASLRPTAYRVVQEALTNVLRHATASRVAVTLTHDPAGLTVEIVDDGTAESPAGPPPAITGTGRGLVGMAERVQAHGGTLETGHVAPRGFRVLARLPGGAG